MKRTEIQSHIVSGSDLLLKQALNAIYIFAALIHVVFLILFSKLGVKEMQIANYFSPIIYLVAFLFNSKNKMVIGATIGTSEAVMHGVLSLFFVGWQAYFHIYILLVYLLIFFLYNFNMALRLLFTFLVTALYISAFVYSGINAPKYNLPQNFIIVSGVINILCTASVLSIFSITYSHFIRKNITILKTAEQQQRTLNGQKNRFFSIFSHDLKNPITTLNGFVDLMLYSYEKIDNTKRKDYLLQIQNSVGDLRKLVDNLLEWSRSQLDNLKIHPVTIDVGPALLEIKSLFSHHAIQKNIELSISSENNIKVFADEQMFHSIMRNIISNAIKFTHHHGKVAISATSEGFYTRFEIADTGIGISPANLDLLFRIDKKIICKGTDNETGTGLGLIVAKEFIEKNHGSISVESVLDKGTRFIINLPSDSNYK